MFYLLRGRFKQVSAMDGVPSFVGWIILLFFLYVIFRVWQEIQKDKSKNVNREDSPGKPGDNR